MQKVIQLFIFSLVSLQLSGQTKIKFPTLKYSEIAKLNIVLPYIKYYGIDSSLLVYGSNHTNNYNDLQVKQIYNLICSFKPTVVLYEGDGITTGKTQKETVEEYFEMGLSKYLADSLKILAVNIEPKTQDKYKFLLKVYKVEDVLLATLGLQITMLQINNESFDTLFSSMISDLVREGLPLKQKQQTLDYFYKLYQRKFGKPFSYKNFDSRDIQAKYNRTIFNRINQMANEFRDQHIIKLTKQFIDRKERIFLIEGGWHAIVCEPAYKLIAK